MTTRRMAWLLAGVVEPREEADLEGENAMGKSTSGPATGSDAMAGTAMAQNLTKKRTASFLHQLLVTVRGGSISCWLLMASFQLVQ